MKQLLVVVNNQLEKPFGMILNAVGHMMVGVGPRIPKGHMPKINVYAGSMQAVREFRARASQLHMEHGEANSVFSDFAHTTTEGTAQDHERQTKETHEKDIQYFAACFCADEAIIGKSQLLEESDFLQLKNIAQSELGNDFEFDEPIQYPDQPDFSDLDKIFKIALNRNLSTPEALSSLIKSCIEISQSVERADLRLHVYPDADGSLHPGMSEYGLVALKGKKNNSIQALAKLLEGVDLDAQVRGSDCVAMLGLNRKLDDLTKRSCQLWRGDLNEEDLEPRSELWTPTFTSHAAASTNELDESLRSMLKENSKKVSLS